MYICICNAITDREIRSAVELGARSVADLKSALGVATCCGRCEESAGRLVADACGELAQTVGGGE
jgi:bacterioferritin-associated ferredoxin